MNNDKQSNNPTNGGFAECVDLQKENTKFFHNNETDKMKAVISSAPIAVYDATEGHYAEVDNSLIEDAENTVNYKNVRGKYKASFAKDLNREELFSMEKDGYKLAISLLSQKRNTGKQHNRNATARVTNNRNQKSESEAVYLNAYADTDLQYQVRPGKVKENIIVRSPQESYSYDFVLKTENLKLTMSDDGKVITFSSIDTDKAVFRIPAPIMKDAAGATSREITYALENTAQNEAVLTVTANAQWINDPARAFPIMIDPVINVNISDYFEMYSYDDEGWEQYSGWMLLGDWHGYCHLEASVDINAICNYINVAQDKITRCDLKICSFDGYTPSYDVYEGPNKAIHVGTYDTRTFNLPNGMSGIEYTIPLTEVIAATGGTNFAVYIDSSYYSVVDQSTATMEIEYTAVLNSISIATPPTKTVYIEGQTFDKTGLKVNAIFDNGSIVTDVTQLCAINKTVLSLGNTQITVSYQGKTASWPIIVIPLAIESITVTTPPNKLKYIASEPFDKTGMVVKATYNNGNVVTLNSGDYTVIPATLTTNTKSVTISYQSKTTTQSIGVLTSIAVTTPPVKTVYFQNEMFQASGMVVTAYYNDNTSQTITGFTISGAGPFNMNDTYVTITYGGITITQAINILYDAQPDSGAKYTHISEGSYIKSGGGEVNLNTGNLRFKHAGTNCNSVALPTDVSLVYNSSMTDYDGSEFGKNIPTDFNCGKGWKLNLQQYLVKQEGTPANGRKSREYVYIDGDGNHHTFDESYYAQTDSGREYLDRNEITIKPDGKLVRVQSGIEQEVKTEIRSGTGLELHSEYEGFKGIELVELRSEELAGVQDELESLRNYKSELEFSEEEYVKKTDKDIIALQGEIENDARQFECDSLYLEREALTTEQERIKIDNLLCSKDILFNLTKPYRRSSDEPAVNFDGYDYTPLATDLCPAGGNSLVKDILIYQKEYNRAMDSKTRYHWAFSTYPQKDYTYQGKDLDNSSSDAVYYYKDEQTMLAANELHWQRRLNKAQYKYRDAVENSQYDVTNKSKDIEFANFEKQKKLEETKDGLITAREKLITKQQLLTDILASKDWQQRYNAYMLLKTRRELEKTKNRIAVLELQEQKLLTHTPVSYITDGNGGTLGFNNKGRLAVIADKHGNYAALEYENGKIMTVFGKEDVSIDFEYNADGKLIKIVCPENKITELAYNGGDLVSIKLPDVESLNGFTGTRMTYFANSLLTEARDISGIAARYTYTPGKKCYLAEEVSYISKVSEGIYQTTDSIDANGIYQSGAADAMQSYSIGYLDALNTRVTDKDGKHIRYVFDLKGKTTTVIKESISAATGEKRPEKVYSYSRKAGKTGITVRDKSAQAVLDGSRLTGFTLQDGKYRGGITSGSSIRLPLMTSIPVSLQNNCYFFGNGAAVKKEAISSLVFSAFAKAEALETGMDAAGRDQAMTNPINFLISVITRYSDNSSDATYCTYDSANKDWQYATVPVAIDPKKTLTSLNLYCVYSQDKDSTCTFLDPQLKYADFEYSEYSRSKKKLLSWDGNNEVKYSYNDDKKLTGTTLTDKDGKIYTASCEYDKNGSPTRSEDYNGIVTENYYDAENRLEKSVTYHKADPSAKYVSEKKYDGKGRLTHESDPRGTLNGKELWNESRYEGDSTLVTGSVSPDGHKTACGFDSTGKLLSVSCDDDGEGNSNNLSYSGGFVTKVNSNGNEAKYEYDGRGRQLKVKLNGAEYLNTAYPTEHTASTTLASGDTFTALTDEDGKAIELKHNNALLLKNDYDVQERISKVTDKAANTETLYTYDAEGRTETVTEKVLGTGTVKAAVTNTCNSDGDVIAASVNVKGTSHSYAYSYEYNLEKRLSGITLPDNTVQTVRYDGFGRMESIRHSGINGGKDIYYLKSGERTTDLVSSIRYVVKGNIVDGHKYRYDQRGNINEIKENGILQARYAYDKLNRLIREDNKAQGTTVTWAYDTNGNIAERYEYAYTPEDELENGAVTAYGYPADGHRDRLASITRNGVTETFAYDAMGNPTVYRGKTMTWTRGRMLAGHGTNTFTYDANGLRIGKNTTEYIYSGGKLLAEVTGADRITYLYGLDGITGIKRNNEVYYFRKTAQGDVTALIDSSGSIVVKYVYDAWGNHKLYGADGSAIPASNTTHIGNVNPIRYRGYYWDGQTGLFYVTSRYYDPQVGRWISADSIDNAMLQMDQLNGLNLYAYCLNNPIRYTDPTGGFVLSITALILIGLGVGAAVGAGVSIVSQGLTVGWDNINWWQVGLDGVLGGISGALAMSPLCWGALIGLNAAIGFVGGVGGNLLNGSDFGKLSTWLDIGLSTGIGALVGVVGGPGATHASVLNPAKYSQQLIKAQQNLAKTMLDAQVGKFANAGLAQIAVNRAGNAMAAAVSASSRAMYTAMTKAFANSLVRGSIVLTSSIGRAYLYQWLSGLGY